MSNKSIYARVVYALKNEEKHKFYIVILILQMRRINHNKFWIAYTIIIFNFYIKTTYICSWQVYYFMVCFFFYYEWTTMYFLQTIFSVHVSF